jgi:hypothetical protein
MIALLGCGGDDGGSGDGVSTDGRDASAPGACLDEDGDGFGIRCRDGADCDDGDPSITDECRRCRMPNKDCPCEPGTESLACDPRDLQATINGKTGRWVCSEGRRYCRDGFWTDCEILWAYATFVED